jgi:hypothetical protein
MTLHPQMFALKAVGLFCLSAFLYWAAWMWPVLPFGSGFFTGLAFFLPLVSLVALGGMVVALVAVLKRRLRKLAIRVLSLCVAVVAGTATGSWLGPSHRMQRIAQVTASAMPLVRAIEAFERDERRPPRGLNEVVPRYLPIVPSTGMGGYSEWQYLKGTDALSYEENPWVLLVHTGGPGINFDKLMYFPNQRYPQFGYGGRIERVGAWGYVHE